VETLEAVRGRKSIRAYLPKPVPQEIVAQILEASRWAPSGSNRQRWRVTVATGERCKALAESLVARAREQKPGVPASRAAPPGERRRTEGLWASLSQAAEAMGSSLREVVEVGSYGLYGAPVVVVVSHSGTSGDDTSRFVTTMLLVAHDLGLGTCWLGIPLHHRDIIHEVLGIPEGERVSAVVALGYPDLDVPINAFRSSREGLETFVRWVGYD
jgi:nitroreductase